MRKLVGATGRPVSLPGGRPHPPTGHFLTGQELSQEVHPSFCRGALWLQKEDGNRKSFTSHSHAATHWKPKAESQGARGKGCWQAGQSWRGVICMDPEPWPVVLREERRAVISSFLPPSFLPQHLNWLLPCVRFCDSKGDRARRSTKEGEIRSCEQGLWGGNRGAQGGVPESSPGRTSPEPCVFWKEPGRRDVTYIETGELGIGLHLLNKCIYGARHCSLLCT